MGIVETRKGVLDFAAADAIVAFARDNGLEVRGHTAVWHINVPNGCRPLLATTDGEDVFESPHSRCSRPLRRYADELGRRQRGDRAEGRDAYGLRNSIFAKALGADYVARAFRVARAALPHAPLYYNDFGSSTTFEGPKRAATLALLADLRRQGLIDGFGVQSHLKLGSGSTRKCSSDFSPTSPTLVCRFC